MCVLRLLTIFSSSLHYFAFWTVTFLRQSSYSTVIGNIFNGIFCDFLALFSILHLKNNPKYKTTDTENKKKLQQIIKS